MEWGWLGSGLSAVGDWLSDTFFGGSKSSKLTAQLNSSLEQQQALLKSYEGTVAQLVSSSSKSYLPWIIGGAGVLGAVVLLAKGKSIVR